MFVIKRIFLILVFAAASFFSFSQLQINPQSNALALAQKLVGTGVTISNVSLTGSSLSTAFFRNQGNTLLGIDSGIVLSTGRVLTNGGTYGLNGPQNQLASSQINTPGDAQLAALVSPRPTNDAVVLEFDFIPVGDTVKFKYVFSSDEYPTFNCSNFNDVFAFFISGPGIAGTANMALVPGTNIPVAINSINSGTPGSGYQLSTCNSMGPGSPFTQFFVNNTGNSYFTLNGHTTVLTAASAVQPCQTYHLKIAIADVQDKSYDSGVFLEAESLKSEPLRLIGSTPTVNGLPYLVEGCHTGGIKIVRSRKSPNPQPVNIEFGGTAVNGVDVQLIPTTAVIPANDSIVFIPIVPITDNMPEGIEYLRIYIANGCVLSNYHLDSIEVQLRDYDTLAIIPANSTGLCKNSSMQLEVPAGFDSYQWFPSAGLNQSQIRNPFAQPLVSTTYSVTAILGTCHAMDSVRLEVKMMEFISKKDINCKNGNSGEIKVAGGFEWNQPVQFNIDHGNYGSDSSFYGLTAGIHMVHIRDQSGCVDSMQVTLVQAFPDLVIAESISNASCTGNNGQIVLSATGGNAPYSFSTDGSVFSTSNSFTVNGGAQNIYVKDANGCTTTRTVNVPIDPSVSFTTTASAASCSGSPDGMIYIQATGGSGQYSYSIDGINFQLADSFLVSTGNLVVTVKDSKGCTSSHAVTIPLNQSVFIDAGADTTICEGASAPLHPVANAASYSWTPAASLSGAAIANPVASPAVTTTYYVTATKDICVAKDSVTVFVRPAPVAFAGVDSSICVGKTIQLSGSGGLRYVWHPTQGMDDPSLSTPTVRPLQTTQYFLQVFDNFNCSSLHDDTVQITLVPAVIVFAGRDTTITKGQLLQLNGMELSNSGASIYQWAPDFGLSRSDIPDPVASLDNDIVYTLTMTTAQGCVGSDNIVVKVYQGPEIYVPTGFTPNDDGKNDLLRPIAVGMKSLQYFRVYNRWGQLIFSTATANAGWDGKINGVKQPSGTYVWVAEATDYKGNRILRRGSTILIR